MSLLTRSTTSPAHAAPLVALLFLMGCDGAAPDTEGTGGNGGAAATSSSDTGSQGDDAAFSRLPPFDVLGVEWEHRYYFFEAAEYHTTACSVIDTFTWPDDTPGSTVRCSWDADHDAYLWKYAFPPGRIELREDKYDTIEAPIVVYRAPVSVGDTWEESRNDGAFGLITQHYTAVAEETADVTHGSVDAVKLEHYSENDGKTSDVVELWWADDLGWVKIWTPTQEGELLWFEVP